MTVPTTTNRISYSGSTATGYPYTFKIFSNSDLEVYQTSGATTQKLTLDADYTVSGAGQDSGGNVTLAQAPAASDILTIRRVLPLTQEIDYQPLDPFPAESHEEGLDRGVMLAQQIQEELGRSLKLAAYTTCTADLTLPEPSARKVLNWNDTADGLENGPTADDIANAQSYASAALVSAAAAASAEANAEAAQAAAEAAQAALDLPSIDADDAGMGLVVKSDGSGWERGAPPPAMIQLTGWQTDPAAYPVESQDAYNTDGHGKDLLAHYVFKNTPSCVMFTQVMLPFSGYDLHFCFPYRMSTTASGDVTWCIRWAAISEDEALAEVDSFATFAGIKDGGVCSTVTASTSTNTYKMLDSTDLKIPASAYSAGEMLVLKFYRYENAMDTHTGNAEVPKNGIYLKPVVPSA